MDYSKISVRLKNEAEAKNWEKILKEHDKSTSIMYYIDNLPFEEQPVLVCDKLSNKWICADSNWNRKEIESQELLKMLRAERLYNLFFSEYDYLVVRFDGYISVDFALKVKALLEMNGQKTYPRFEHQARLNNSRVLERPLCLIAAASTREWSLAVRADEWPTISLKQLCDMFDTLKLE